MQRDVAFTGETSNGVRFIGHFSGRVDFPKQRDGIVK